MPAGEDEREKEEKTLSVQTFEGVRRYGGDLGGVSVLNVAMCLTETRPLPLLRKMGNLVCYLLLLLFLFLFFFSLILFSFFSSFFLLLLDFYFCFV